MTVAVDQIAIDAFVTHLRDRLGAELATQDAARAAVIRCPVGPYTISNGSTLIVNGVTATLAISGSQTASAVATAIGSQLTGVTASADSDGRLVLTRTGLSGPVGPSDDAPSQLVLGAGTANASLGLVQTVSDVQRLSISAPAPIVLPHSIESRRPVDRPVIAIEKTDVPAVAPLRGEVWSVTLSTTVVMPGALANAESVLEALRSLCSAIAAVVRDGDGRGRNRVGGAAVGSAVVDCLHVRTSVPATLLEASTNRGNRYGVAQDEWRVRVYSTEV